MLHNLFLVAMVFAAIFAVYGYTLKPETSEG